MLRRTLLRSPLFAGLFAMLLIVSVTVFDGISADFGAPAGAQGWETAAEEDLLERHNAHRVANGLQPLVRDPALDQVARSWTASMAQSEVLAHRTDLQQAVENTVTTDWRRIGENVGWGPSTSWLHDAFVASPGHNANILGDYNRIGIGATLDDDGDLWVTINFLDGPELEVQPEPNTEVPAIDPVGGWVVDERGRVEPIGSAPHYGDLANFTLAQPIVGIAPTPSGKGYWLVATDGGIFAFGDAAFFGSTGAIRLNQPIVGMAPTPSGNGYWLVARDGGIFAFGDAAFFGSTGAIRLNQPIVGMTPTPSGNGYWLVARDGGIFAFGDAGFHGSAGSIPTAAPMVGIAATASGRGYWIVGQDGGVFAFGDASYEGTTIELGLATEIVGMTAASEQVQPAADAAHYWLFTADGEIYGFGRVDGRAGSADSAIDAVAGA